MKKIKKWLSLMLAIVIMVSTIMCNNISVLAEGSGNDTTARMMTVTNDDSKTTVTGSGYDSITINFTTSNLLNGNKFRIYVNVENPTSDMTCTGNGLSRSNGSWKNDDATNANNEDVTLSNLNGRKFTITVEKREGNMTITADKNETSATVSYTITSEVNDTYSDKTFENPSADSLGSVEDFAVFANTYTINNHMEGNFAANEVVANYIGGNSTNLGDNSNNLNYVNKLTGSQTNNLVNDNGDSKAIIILGENNTILKDKDGTYTIVYSEQTTTENGETVTSTNTYTLGAKDKISKVVNEKNSTYKIDFTTAMDGLKDYANALFSKDDSASVTFKDVNGNVCEKTGSVATIELPEQNYTYYIKINASDLVRWNESTININNLGTGSIVFNIVYDQAVTFDKPDTFVIDDNTTYGSGYESNAGHILLNFGSQTGGIVFENDGLHAGCVLAPCASVTVKSTHNGSIYANTVENTNGEIHRNPWTTTADYNGDISFSVTGQKTLDGVAPTTKEFTFKLVEIDKDTGNALTDATDYTATNKDSSGNCTGTFTFDSITYSKEGAHYYKVTEVDNSKVDNSVTYDSTVYYVKVSVNKGDGNSLVATPTYYKDSLTGEGSSTNNITFSNTTKYVSANVTFTGKKVLHVDGDTESKSPAAANMSDKTFTFKLTQVTDETGKTPVSDGVTMTTGSTEGATYNKETGEFEFAPIPYTQTDIDKTYYYLIEEETGSESQIEYDTTKYIAKVDITCTDGVNLNVTKTITKITTYESANATTAETKTGIEFNNKIVERETFTTIGGTKYLAKAGDASDKATANTKYTFQIVEVMNLTGAELAGAAAFATTNNTDNGEFEFNKDNTGGTLTYTEIGTHYYKLSEVEGSDSSIDYDTTVYLVRVDVTLENNELKATNTYYKKANSETTSYALVTGENSGISFTNEYTGNFSASVTFDGKKYLDGVEVAEEGAYSFTLTETESDYSTVKETVKTVKNKADGTFEFSKITYDRPGDYYYIIKEVDGGELHNSVYYDEAVYRVKVTVSEDGKVTKNIEVVPYEGAGVAEASGVVFNNYTVKVLGASASRATIEGTKTLQDVSGKTLEMEAGQFRFGLFDAEGNQIDTATNDESGNFTFRSLTYYGEDNETYTYTVKEIDTNDTGNYQYDSTVYTVTVTNGKVTYQKDGEAVDAMEFTNVKNTTAAQFDPLVYKVLKNQEELQAGQFTFALYEYNPETEEVGKQLDTSSNTNKGNVVFQSITYDKAGTYDYVIKEVIPDSTGRIVYDTGSVYVHVVVKMNGDGKLEADVTYTKDGGESVDGENAGRTFVNTYQQINLRVQKRSKDAPYDPLQGAVYALYKVQGSKSVLIGQQESDENGYMTFENIEPGTYYFKEVSAPAGHTVDEYATSAFVVMEKGSISYDVSDAVSALTGGTVEGESQSVQLSGASVAALALEASDEDSTTTTTEETTTLTAEDVADEVVKIEVSKVDADTHEYVAGAKMQIIKKSTNEVVAEWTTGTEAKTYERTLDNGYTLDVNTKYILREEEAPEGYDTAEDTVFILDDYGVMTIISGGDAKLSDKYGLTVYDEQLDVQKTETIQKEKHTEKEITTTTTKNVKTGDNSPVGLLLAVMIASAGVIVVSLAVRRRKTK